MPGMTCKVKLVAYLQDAERSAVPPKSLMTDELDEQKHSVKVLEKDGKTTRPARDRRPKDRQAGRNPQGT